MIYVITIIKKKPDTFEHIKRICKVNNLLINMKINLHSTKKNKSLRVINTRDFHRDIKMVKVYIR